MRLSVWLSVLLTLAIPSEASAQRVSQDRGDASALPSHVIVDSCSGCGGSGVVGQATMAASAPVVIASDQSALNINCLSGCGSPPATPDTAAFTAGVTNVSLNAGVYDDTLAALSAGISAAYRMTAYRALHVTLRDTAGNAVSPLTDTQLRATAVPVSGAFGTQYNTGVAAPTPTVGTVTLAKVTDGLTTYGVGDLQPLAIDSVNGSLLTTVENTVSIADVARRDDATILGTYVTMAGAFYDDVVPGTLTENDPASLRVSSNRNLYTTIRDAANNERGVTVSAANALKVDGSAVTQPVSGTFWQTTQPISDAVQAGAIANIDATMASFTKELLVSSRVSVANPLLVDGTSSPLSLTTAGALRSDVTYLGGNAINTGVGSSSTGTLRVVLATDQPALTNKLLVTPDSVALPANQSVNVAQFGATNVSTGTGAAGAGIPRVTVSNDSNVLATQSGTWTVAQGTAATTTAGWPVTNGTVAAVTAAWTNATALNTALALTVTGYASTAVQLNLTSSTATGTILFETTLEGTNWAAVLCNENTTNVATGVAALGTTIIRIFQCPVQSVQQFRLRLSQALTGAGTVNVTVQASAAPVTVAKAMQSGTWTVQPGNTPNTTAWLVSGDKTNNNAAPGATNVGALDALANAAPPTWTEGNQVAHSVDLTGNLRTTTHPPAVLGCYAVSANAAYTATTINGIIFSFRWADATRFAVIYRVTANVVATAFTTAGLIERQLILVRSFTASDTGGTAVTPAANNAELRTSFGTSLATDVRVGGFLSAGTGTADANPLAAVAGWMPAAGIPIPMTELFDARGGVQYPIVLAQNEGFRIRLGAAETASTRQTFVNVVWCEATAF